MTWNYRGFIDYEGNTSIREVFYDEDGVIDVFSVEPSAPWGETEVELVEVLEMMLKGLKKPFLLESDLVPKGQEEEIIDENGNQQSLH